MSNLNKENKKLKALLENLLNKNKAMMEYYHLMYKSRTSYGNDLLKDIPLIISNSFYNDYRLDDKTALELETSNNTIPKYSSLEKKAIREETKDISCLEYFVSLLKGSNNSKKYDKFIEKMDVVLNLYPLYNEIHYKYFTRAISSVDGYEKDYKKLEDKAKLSDDYEDICLKIKIAYRKNIPNWDEAIKEMVKDHFDLLYKNKENDADIKKYFNIANSISYKSYLDTINNLKKEKEVLERSFEKEKKILYSENSDNYLLRFKESLIKSYYDKRYKLLIAREDVDSYVKEAISLYSLAVDLENRVLEYYLYLAAHSKRLLRSNDVESAIIANLYSLYSPLDCLERFEEVRKEFGEKLSLKSNDFKKKYNSALLTKRVEYGFKGMIPNVSAIKIRLNERCKEFIIENCLENMINFDETNMYDTRNYDLEVLCDRLSVSEIVDLYGRLKQVFMNFNNSLIVPQQFICKVISNKLDNQDDRDIKDRMIEICNTYLKEEPLFI